MVSHGWALEALLSPRMSIACLLLPPPVSSLLKFLSPLLTFLLPLSHQIPTFFLSRTATATAMADVRSPSAFLRRIQHHAPPHSSLLALLALFISASILVFLSGLTVTAAAFAFLFLSPIILFTSPLWAPIAFFFFLSAIGILSFAALALAAAAALSWAYRYYKGMHPPGSNQIEYARTRIYDTASHVKDYAREYGGYLQSKVKDAAPGA